MDSYRELDALARAAGRYIHNIIIDALTEDIDEG